MAREQARKPESERCRQNLPIDNELKMKRVYQTEPIDLSCWAYMRTLRQVGGTKKVYPVNPYVEVYQFQESVYGLLTENSDGMGDPWMYLVLGPEKALLVDTGFGIGDLKGLCDQLTGGKELVVVNTHAHVDHASGNFQFERVHCHAFDVPLLQAQGPQNWDYLFEHGDRNGRCIWEEFDPEDIVGFRPYEIVGCAEGRLFDLGGGHQVELFHMGGHTAGHCALLDRTTRSLFLGDDLVAMRVGVFGPKPGTAHPEAATVTALRNGYRKLAACLSEFDHVYAGHFITDLEKEAVLSMLQACEAICADPAQAYSYVEEGETRRYFRYVEGLGTIAYTENSFAEG